MTTRALGESGPPRVDAPVLAAVVVTTLLWASAFVVIRYARSYFNPGELALGRLLAGSAALSVLVALQRPPLPARRDVPRIVLFGILWLGVYNVALNAGERLIDAGTAAMLVNVAPVMIAIVAALVLRERLGRALIAGLAIALAGAVVIGWSSGRHHGGIGGAALCLLAAVVYTAAVSIQKPLLARTSASALTWVGCLAGAVVCLPFAPRLLTELGHAPAGAILLVVYLGVGPTAIAFTTWAFALSRSSLARQGATTYLVPPLVVLIGWLALGEVPPALALAGGALCLLGVAVTRRRRVA